MPISTNNGAPTDFARCQVLNMTQIVELQVVGRATEKVKTSASSQVSGDSRGPKLPALSANHTASHTYGECIC